MSGERHEIYTNLHSYYITKTMIARLPAAGRRGRTSWEGAENVIYSNVPLAGFYTPSGMAPAMYSKRRIASYHSVHYREYGMAKV